MLRNFPDAEGRCAPSIKPCSSSRYAAAWVKASSAFHGPDNDSYPALYTTAAGTRRQHFTSLPKLFASISGKMKTVRYQIQQGLHLIDIGGSPVDFRALVQKNETGKWTVTSIVARTAGSHHFVSNLARGGTLSTVREAVGRSNLIAAPAAMTQPAKRAAALDIAQGIDMFIPAHFGELGIDFALDTRAAFGCLK